MNQFKRAQVIILPTEEKQLPLIQLYQYKGNNRLCIDKDNDYPTHKFYKPIHQHLYIISDDEIKVDDYFLADNRISQSHNDGKPNWVLCKCTKIKNTWIYCNEIPDEGHNGDWCKKIIATTDISLNYIKHDDSVSYPKGEQIFLSQPSPQFIEKYIEEYNKGNQIKDVLVEYEQDLSTITKVGELQYWNYKLKVNSKDNTITIKKLKDSWNREEIIKLMNIAYLEGSLDGNNKTFDELIQENL